MVISSFLALGERTLKNESGQGNPDGISTPVLII